MQKENFKKWKISIIGLALIIVIGIMITVFFPEKEGIGVALIFPSYLFTTFVSTQINFDNKRLWAGFTFVVPYIAIPIMLFRSYDNVKIKEQRKKKENNKKAIDNIQQMIEEYLLLIEKSTIPSMLQAGNIWMKIADTPNNMQPLSALVLDRNCKINIRIKGIEMLSEIDDNDFFNEVIFKLANDSNQQIKNIIQQLKQKNNE